MTSTSPRPRHRATAPPPPRRPPASHPAAGRGGTLPLGETPAILAVRPDNIGDVVMIEPALRALRRAAPGARIDLLTSPAGAAVAPMIEAVDDTMAASVSWQDAHDRAVLPVEQLALVGRIAERRYDVAVIFTSFSQSPWPAAYVCALAGIPVRLGASREFGGALLTHWVDDLPDGVHQADRALLLLRRVGVGAGASGVPRLTVPTWAARGGAAARPRAAGPYAVVLPGASCASRRYPADRFAEVARGIAASGRRVLVAGSRSEADLLERVRAGAGADAVGLAGPLALPELAALLRGADVVVTNNSGGAHLADAVRPEPPGAAPAGRPWNGLVTLFAGTERESEYAPRSGSARVLRRPTSCSPCRAFTCPYGHECLDIPPAEVVAAAIRPGERADAARAAS